MLEYYVQSETARYDIRKDAASASSAAIVHAYAEIKSRARYGSLHVKKKIINSDPFLANLIVEDQ